MKLPSMTAKELHEWFISRAHEKHPDGRYGYELVRYKGDRKAIRIKCNECLRIFKQTPNKHFSGRGCSDCGGSKPLNNQIFEQRGKEIHGDLYGYDLVMYKNNQTEVKLKCNQCGQIFKQRPDKHLMGRGCPDCGAKKGSRNNTLTFENFEIKAREVHDDKFTYFNHTYKNRDVKTIIKCNQCGENFKQTPSSHIQGNGCPFCAGHMLQTLEQFIDSVKPVTGNDFNYDLSIYINDTTKIIIKCNNCNKTFERRPFNHRNGAKCPYCIRRISILECDFLNYYNILNDANHRQVRIGRFAVDGYDDKTNTIC